MADKTEMAAGREGYDIRAVASLEDYLSAGYSLCVVHHPVWQVFEERAAVDASPGGRVRLVKIVGHDRQGAADEVLLGICGSDDQGYYRHKLDQNLTSPFLFITWKRGRHGFRLIRERRTAAAFATFAAALAVYLPDGFTPEYALEPKRADETGFDPDGFELGDGIA